MGMRGAGGGGGEAFMGMDLARKPPEPGIRLFDGLSVPVALVETERQSVLHANRAFGELAGFDADALRQQPLGAILPCLAEDRPIGGERIDIVDAVRRSGRMIRLDEVAVAPEAGASDAGAGTRWWDFTFAPLERDGKAEVVVVSAVEATSRMVQRLRSEEALRQVEERADKALREANHRARNSLQLVVSLLSLQAAGITLREERARFSEATRRVAIIAEAHIQSSGRSRAALPGRIDLADYLRRVCLRLAEGDPGVEALIGFDAGVEPAPIQAERAASLGLLVHEAVSEILFQGRGPSPASAVRLRLDPHPAEAGYRMTIARLGPPPCRNSGTAQPQMLGRQFVPALAEQVGCLVEEDDEEAGLLVVSVPA